MDTANDKHEYMAKLWGGFFNEEHQAKHGRKQGYYYFDTDEERERFLDLLRSEEQALEAHSLGIEKLDGTDVRYKTVAKMRFTYKGKEYPLDHEFGYAYPVESAHHMYHEGNYACDCNRSLFLAAKHEGFPELDCGQEVVLTEFNVVRIKGGSGKFLPM